jgi:hypothetical protein
VEYTWLTSSFPGLQRDLCPGNTDISAINSYVYI